jgi:transposase
MKVALWAEIRRLAEMAKYPDLSAVRIREEIARGPDGYTGSATLVRRYLRKVRPARGRVYQEVHYQPAQAMQVDWGDCGYVQVGRGRRKVSVFVAVLCYSRLLYIDFTLSQRKAEFYRCLVNALTFFGGSPRVLIVDNLKTAVLNGAGRNACFHPEFLGLCSRSPVPHGIRSRRGSSKAACVMSSTTLWPAAPRS